MDLDPVDHTAKPDLEMGPTTGVCSLVAGIVTKEIHTDEPENKFVYPDNDISIGDLLALATPDFRPSDESIFSPDRLAFPLDDLLCGVCKHIVNQAVETPCCQQFFFARIAFGCCWKAQPNAQSVVASSWHQVLCQFIHELEASSHKF